MRTLTLDVRREKPVEIGAKLYSLLCFPGSAESEKAARTASALISTFLLNARRVDPDDDEYVAGAWPGYRVRDNRAAIDGLADRSKHAMDVGGLTLTYLKQPRIHVPPKLPNGVKHTLTDMFSMILNHPEDHIVHDARKRIWRRWMPVAHVAAAYRAKMNRLRISEFSWHLDDLDEHRRRVHEANDFASTLASLNEFPWALSDPVMLDWIE